MIAVIQRAKSGSVSVDEKIISQIEFGFVILLGVTDEDDKTDADYLADKITHLRVFNDENKKMNYAIKLMTQKKFDYFIKSEIKK